MKNALIREQWARRIQRWKDSGLPAKAFAAELGINARSLAWWKWELSKSEAAVVTALPRRRRSRSAPAAATLAKTISPITFVEMTASLTGEPLEIVLPSTLRVRVPVGFDDATLVRLLDVMDRRR